MKQTIIIFLIFFSISLFADEVWFRMSDRKPLRNYAASDQVFIDDSYNYVDVTRVKPFSITLRVIKTINENNQISFKWNPIKGATFTCYLDGKIIDTTEKNEYTIEKKIRSGYHNFLITCMIEKGKMSSNFIEFIK